MRTAAMIFETKRLGELSIAEFHGQRNVPYATLSLTLGHDRKLYYAAVGHEFDYGGSAEATPSHLITYDLKTGRIEDLGEMRMEDGGMVLGTNAADTAGDGTSYFVGTIEMKAEPGKPAEGGGRVGGRAYRLALLAYHPRI